MIDRPGFGPEFSGVTVAEEEVLGHEQVDALSICRENIVANARRAGQEVRLSDDITDRYIKPELDLLQSLPENWKTMDDQAKGRWADNLESAYRQAFYDRSQNNRQSRDVQPPDATKSEISKATGLSFNNNQDLPQIAKALRKIQATLLKEDPKSRFSFDVSHRSAQRVDDNSLTPDAISSLKKIVGAASEPKVGEPTNPPTWKQTETWGTSIPGVKLYHEHTHIGDTAHEQEFYQFTFDQTEDQE